MPRKYDKDSIKFVMNKNHQSMGSFLKNDSNNTQSMTNLINGYIDEG